MFSFFSRKKMEFNFNSIASYQVLPPGESTRNLVSVKIHLSDDNQITTNHIKHAVEDKKVSLDDIVRAFTVSPKDAKDCQKQLESAINYCKDQHARFTNKPGDTLKRYEKLAGKLESLLGKVKELKPEKYAPLVKSDARIQQFSNEQRNVNKKFGGY